MWENVNPRSFMSLLEKYNEVLKGNISSFSKFISNLHVGKYLKNIYIQLRQKSYSVKGNVKEELKGLKD